MGDRDVSPGRSRCEDRLIGPPGTGVCRKRAATPKQIRVVIPKTRAPQDLGEPGVAQPLAAVAEKIRVAIFDGCARAILRAVSDTDLEAVRPRLSHRHHHRQDRRLGILLRRHGCDVRKLERAKLIEAALTLEHLAVAIQVAGFERECPAKDDGFRPIEAGHLEITKPGFRTRDDPHARDHGPGLRPVLFDDLQ